MEAGSTASRLLGTNGAVTAGAGPTLPVWDNGADTLAGRWQNAVEPTTAGSKKSVEFEMPTTIIK